MSSARAVRHIEIGAVRGLMERLLRAAGCDEEGARTCAEVFLDADLKGIGLQGLDHMATLVRHLRIGHTDPHARPKVVREFAAGALVFRAGRLRGDRGAHGLSRRRQRQAAGRLAAGGQGGVAERPVAQRGAGLAALSAGLWASVSAAPFSPP